MKAKQKNPLLKKIWYFGAILFTAIFLISGCTGSNKKEIKKAIHVETERLKNPDKKEIEQYLNNMDSTYTDSTPELLSLEPEIRKILTEYFRDFSYKVKNISAKKDTATADMTIKNIDAKTLAKDYTSAALAKRVANDANPAQVDFSLKDSFLLLEKTLKKNDYKLVENTFSIQLKKSRDTWEVVHTDELDNFLTGNFFTYMADSKILSPEEVVQIHFDTIRDFDTEQLNIYLSLDSLLDTDDSYTSSIAHAMAAQINKFFDYKILSSHTGQRTAKISLEITSSDFESIVSSYQKELEAWLQTSEAMAGGSEGRREKERELLLNSIENNDVSTKTQVEITLLNDGMSWKLQMNNDIAQAILGGVNSTLADVSEDVE